MLQPSDLIFLPSRSLTASICTQQPKTSNPLLNSRQHPLSPDRCVYCIFIITVVKNARILVWLPHPATLGQLGLQHDRPDTIEEVIASAPTPNRYWRMLIDPGFSPLVANPGPPIVMVEAFLGLTHQV
ncbi:hypothetical protein BHM03_00034660 [Ensete ventricosum]|nr:hypothetical protein BHM03_00034660 [Ensete ventricosum]